MSAGPPSGSGLLRRVVPSLGESLGPPPSGDEPRAGVWGPVGWFIGLRWLAFVAVSAAVLAATIVRERVGPADAVALWLGVGALAGFNASLLFVSQERLARTGALLVQVGFDVALLGYLLVHSGGVTNPFAALFVFHAVVAAVVLDAPRASWVAVAIAGFVLVLTLLEITGALDPGCVRGVAGSCEPEVARLRVGAAGFATTILVLGASFLVVPLVRLLREDRTRLRRALSELSDNADRLDVARAEVQAEREKLQTIIDCMADAVLFADPAGNLRLRNRAAAALWQGQPPADEDLRVCHTPEMWTRLLEKVAHPDPVEEHPLLRVGDKTFEASYAAVSEPDGSTRGVVMVARDVTERIEAQEKQVVQERMAVVGKLAAGLAHEINNPLGAMVLFTQHALKGIEPAAPLAEHLQTILRNANHCKKIVKDLLDYARQRPPEWTQIAVEELLGDVVRTLRPQAEHCKVALASAVDCGADCRLEGDPGQLRQVLVNLGLNAIEAMPGGGCLELRARRLDGHIEVEVADTGTGIAPDDEPRIFSAFFTTKTGGTGLGLAVARDLVLAHGGVLSFRTALGQGTTFTAKLPTTRPRKEMVT